MKDKLFDLVQKGELTHTQATAIYSAYLYTTVDNAEAFIKKYGKYFFRTLLTIDEK